VRGRVPGASGHDGVTGDFCGAGRCRVGLDREGVWGFKGAGVGPVGVLALGVNAETHRED